MRYRSIVLMLAGLAIGLAAIGLWIQHVTPLVKATPSAQMPAAGGGTDPGHQLRVLVKGTLVLTLTLMTVLLLMGIFVTIRDWLRRPPVQRTGEKTQYVDAWKLAAERLKEPEAE
jgi:hypothetical protein